MTALLLIEDNLDCARMVTKLLVPHGYGVEHAANGFAGLQMAHQMAHDSDLALILADINLPDLSGHAVILQIRRTILPSTPIVAFTAENGPKVKRIALGLGCDGFISKPIDTVQFPCQIEQFIKVPSLHV